MTDPKRAPAIQAADGPPRSTKTIYPGSFAARVAGRDKRPLGVLFALTNFGVNHTRLAPGAMSALRHAHARQDELIYVLEGTPASDVVYLEISTSPMSSPCDA